MDKDKFIKAIKLNKEIEEFESHKKHLKVQIYNTVVD